MKEVGTPAVNSGSGGSGNAAMATSTKLLDYIISGVIMLTFLLVPFFFSGMAAQGLGFEKMSLFYFLVLLGIVAWVTKGVLLGELKLRRTPLDLPILAFLGLATISSLLSVSIKDSLIGSYGQSSKSLAAIFVFALFYYLLVNNFNKKLLKNSFISLVISTGLVSLYSTFQLLGKFILPLQITKNVAFNTLGSASGLTMFLIVALPLLVVALAQVKEIFPKLNSIAFIVTRVIIGLIVLDSLLVLFMLNGFVGWVGWATALTGMVVVLMFFLSKIIKISNNNIVFPVLVFLCLVVLMVMGNFNLINVSLPAEVSLSRSASWDIAKASLKSDPLFGSGPSTFYYDFSKFKNQAFNGTPLWNIRFDSASGILFDILATYGILGSVAMIAVVLILLSTSFLSLIKTKEKDLNSVGLALFASALTAVMLSLLYALNNSTIIAFVIFGSFAASTAIYLYVDELKTFKLSFRASAKYALALAAIFLTAITGVVILFTLGLKMYIADTYAKDAIMTTDNNKKVEYLSKAISLAPYRDEYYSSIANAFMALANQEALSGGDQTKIQNNLSLAIENSKKSVELNPEKAKNNEALALIYENASFYTRGALEWSEKYYNKVMELDPQNPTPYLRIALVNMARSNAETDNTEKEYYINEAIKKYDEALAKKDDLASAHYGKAIAYEKLGQIDQAIESLRNATILSRNNIDYRFELGRLFFNKGVSQPNITQNGSKEIVTGEGEDGLSVDTNQPTGGTIQKTAELVNAEQLFLSIIQENPSHANALYSLAVMYQKVGETENAKVAVQRLLDVLQEGPTKDAVKQQFQGLY